ncbi:ABC-type metal ion transport system, periplasmic component/surface antigen [Halobacteroides halobius DSM 5150]|uniref:Lipoprotein n=1 Tax=Halobacteroides halobius (strain ATCC 35273 / DSM 5150 / MD-1) TaxID=748449 RepID=L0KCS0_HALHC|nr:MetQ/NlpA family ABC transporter substrate-binding protein [Halobacteroides halobius]AGB42189.1 ABC-type metal ion transport system, periplasmic component/surface antigen [Halobacteroides halobius DSM 5150]
MKKISLILIVLLVGALAVGCTGGKETAKKDKTLVVGATPVPHAEILKNVVKPILAKEGITLKVKEFTDYVTPNLALADGSIDANYFQHIPYLKNFKKNRGLDLTYITKVHLEPMGLYSKKISKLNQLEKGAAIAIPNDATNEGRALLLLESAGLIKLSQEAGLEATPQDIKKNPKNLKFKELAAPQLPRALKDVSAAIINTNYALEADLIPTKDAIIIEGNDSPYANVLAVKSEDKDNPLLKKLADTLTTQQVREYIKNKYEGAIVSVF